MSTDSAGAKLIDEGNLPFGEAWYTSASTTKWRFTTYERDTESGNDYAMQRYYINRFGRFSSVDPVGGDLTNPQTWNRYTYVGNDPVNLVDPLGLRWDKSCVQTMPDGFTVCEYFWVDDASDACPRDGCDDSPHPGHGHPDPKDPKEQKQKSYADCVKEDGEALSVQGMIKSASDGKYGNGFIASALLGNPVSDAISLTQMAFNGDYSGSGGKGAGLATEKAVDKTIEAGSELKNVSVRMTEVAVVTVQTPASRITVAASVSRTAEVPLGILGKAAGGAAKVLSALNVWNYGVSAMSSMVCAIGR